jgi:predicted GNAT family N-acyltransferase
MEVKIAQNVEDINTCYKLREIIFIQEQNVPIEEEIDDNDRIAIHFLLFNEIPVGVGRIVVNGDVAIVGRIGIIKDYRNKGAGAFLMKEIIAYCKKQNLKKIILGAQEQALNFYKKLGFKVCSEKYIDANIPHFKCSFRLCKNI